jgi:DNA-binding NtrC family response regulator
MLDTHKIKGEAWVVDQLVILAKALATEIETLKAELSRDQKKIDLNDDGFNFYDEVERYEIELIRSALNQCGGNQTQAAKLLHLKSTTLHAKMKHYGLNPARSIMFQRQKATQTK